MSRWSVASGKLWGRCWGGDRDGAGTLGLVRLVDAAADGPTAQITTIIVYTGWAKKRTCLSVDNSVMVSG